MSHAELAARIEAAWEKRAELTPQSKGPDVEAIDAALELLDTGQARVNDFHHPEHMLRPPEDGESDQDDEGP